MFVDTSILCMTRYFENRGHSIEPHMVFLLFTFVCVSLFLPSLTSWRVNEAGQDQKEGFWDLELVSGMDLEGVVGPLWASVLGMDLFFALGLGAERVYTHGFHGRDPDSVTWCWILDGIS